MTVQEIFNNKAVKEVEQEILSVYFDVEKGRLRGEAQLLTIRKLLLGLWLLKDSPRADH